MLILSKATKLGDVVFQSETLGVEWITLAVRVITREHRDLRQISVNVPFHLTCLYLNGGIRKIIGDELFEQWLDLDRVLVYIWESLSIHTNVRWTGGVQKGFSGDYIECLLPEMTRRGMVTVDLA